MSAPVFRLAREADIPAIRAAETTPDARPYLTPQPVAQIAARMADPDQETLMIARDGVALGYMLWAGLTRADGVLELRRIAISQTGRGHGTAALRALLAQAFTERSAHKVWLDTVEDNHRGQHVYRKLGFVEEGRQREAFLNDGKRKDLILYGLLQREWDAS